MNFFYKGEKFMKKTGKLAVLLLVVAMLCTVFAVTSSADYTTKVLLNKDCSSGATDAGKVNVNPSDDNYYLSYRYVASPDVYDFGVTQSNAFNGDWAYMTLDYDLMTETTYESGNGTSLYVMTRDGGGSPLGIRMIRVASNSDGTAKIVGAISGESYEIPGEDFSWVHITNVLMFKHDITTASEVTNDKSILLTYVNGELALTQTGVVTERSLNINGFRLQSATKTVSDATVCVDNVKLVLLGKGYDGNLTKLFDGGDHSLTDEDFDVAFTKDYKIPFGKKRAGVFNLAGYETLYDKTQAAFDAAKDGYEIKLYDDVSNVEIKNAITVDTNGHNFSWIPGDLAVTKTERNGSTVYTFKKTDRYAYFTFYPEGEDGEADGVDIPVPIGATPTYTGDKLKLTYEDADGRYFVFKEWGVFGETPVTPVTTAEIDSYFDLYPVYEEKKAPTTGKIVYSNDCEKGGLSLSNGASATFGSSGLVKAAGNNYYRYFAVLDAAGNSNPGGTSAFIMLPFGVTQFTDLSYYTIEFDISTEGIAAAGNFQHTGRN
ncbi:MAG TPA: hypothetical protein DDY70_06310, partial [Clostridiales bacterium]|nr:hypothetical protein [Clostridiales bacterium]